MDIAFWQVFAGAVGMVVLMLGGIFTISRTLVAPILASINRIDASLNERIDQQTASLNARIDRQTERIDQQTARIDALAERVGTLAERMARVEERVGIPVAASTV